MRSGEQAAAPSTPRPPAFDTAAARAGTLAPPIPARTMGCSIPSILQIRLFSAIALSIQTRLADLSHLSPLHLLRHQFGASFGQIFGRTLDDPPHLAPGDRQSAG